jgi:hypothetical protein
MRPFGQQVRRCPAAAEIREALIAHRQPRRINSVHRSPMMSRPAAIGQY